MISRDFLLAGNATFTIEHPATSQRPAGWFTYRIEAVEASERWPAAWFVKVLCGPNNEADYVYLGKLDDFTGEVRPTARTPDSFRDSYRLRLLNRVLCRVWGGEGAVIEAAGFRVHHEGHCGRCGHLLTTPLSVESGIGPECARIMGVERTAAAPTPLNALTAVPLPVGAWASDAARKSAKSEQLEQTYEASERSLDLFDVTDITPVYDSEGELVWWNGTREGRPVRIFND